MAKVTRHVHGEVRLCVVHYDFITTESVGHPCLLAGIAGRVDRLWQSPLDRLGHETLQWLGHHRVGRVGRVRDSVGGRGSFRVTRVVHCLLVSLREEKAETYERLGRQTRHPLAASAGPCLGRQSHRLRVIYPFQTFLLFDYSTTINAERPSL